MNQTITDLKLDISLNQQALVIKQATLSILEKEEKKYQPFSHSAFGGMLFKSARFMTSAFASMHKNFDDQLCNPSTYQSDKLVRKSSRLLNKSNNLSRKNDEKTSTKMALQLAEHVCKVEDFTERYKDLTPVHETTLCQMRKAVESLRPPRDKNKAQRIQEAVEAGFDDSLDQVRHQTT